MSPKQPELPRREATLQLAVLAIGLVFLVGVALGFILGRTL